MSWMRKIVEFFDEEKNWIAGCFLFLGVMLLKIQVWAFLQGQRPVTFAALASIPAMLASFHAAWGIFCQSLWGKRVGFAISMVMTLSLLESAVRAPSGCNLMLLAASIWFCWSLWHLDQRDWREIADDMLKSPDFQAWRERFLKEHELQPLPGCEVILHCSKLLKLDGPMLCRAITQAFHRPCSISEEEDNIGLAVDIASSTAEQAVIGGYGSMWMIGVSPVCLQVVTMPAGNEQNDDGGFIHLNLTRQLDRDTEIINGYSWTIPLAAALWSAAVEKASLANDEGWEFATPDDLLAAIPQLA